MDGLHAWMDVRTDQWTYVRMDGRTDMRMDRRRDMRMHGRAIFFVHFCLGTMTTHAESINLDLQRGLDRRLRHTTLNTEQNQLAIKVSADN